MCVCLPVAMAICAVTEWIVVHAVQHQIAAFVICEAYGIPNFVWLLCA